jgi:hypothetical protein
MVIPAPSDRETSVRAFDLPSFRVINLPRCAGKAIFRNGYVFSIKSDRQSHQSSEYHKHETKYDLNDRVP